MSARWDAAAAQFHAENPVVMEELRALALTARRAGRQRLGIGQLFEVLRWDSALATGGDEYKLNNNYRAWYSRRLMETTPALVGMFDVRGEGAMVGIADGIANTLDAPPSPYDDGEGDDGWITERAA